jgi:hypothetical protein
MTTFEKWVDVSVIGDIIRREFREAFGREPREEEVIETWLSCLEHLHELVEENLQGWNLAR